MPIISHESALLVERNGIAHAVDGVQDHLRRALLARAPLSTEERRTVEREAADMVRAARKSAEKQVVVESFLQQFSLGTREGLALMCLAEALLRTPDAETRIVDPHHQRIAIAQHGDDRTFAQTEVA